MNTYFNSSCIFIPNIVRIRDLQVLRRRGESGESQTAQRGGEVSVTGGVMAV